MSKFIVTMTRTRTIHETATVVVNSSNETYAKKDATAAAARIGWSKLDAIDNDVSFLTVTKTIDTAKET